MNATEDDTELVLRRWKNTSRLFKNKVAIEAKRVETTSTTGEFSEVAPLVSGKRGREVFINGDVDYGGMFHTLSYSISVAGTDTKQVFTSGMAMGLINDIPTCAELLQRIEREAEAAIARMNKLTSASRL